LAARRPNLPDDISNTKVPPATKQCATRGYTKFCELTAGRDHRTKDPALDIHPENIENGHPEEIEKGAWLPKSRGRVPGGRRSREGGPNSPFVGELLTVGR
jgi:ferritin-like protein